MSTVRWELYPLVAASAHPRAWLQLQSHLQLAPNTVDAYGRCLNDFLAFCQRSGIVPEAITREQVALYVHDLAHRPNPKGAKILAIERGRGLSNATLQQRITVYACFAIPLSSSSSARTTQWVGVITLRAKPSAGFATGGSFPITTSSPAAQRGGVARPVTQSKRGAIA